MVPIIHKWSISPYNQLRADPAVNRKSHQYSIILRHVRIIVFPASRKYFKYAVVRLVQIIWGFKANAGQKSVFAK